MARPRCPNGTRKNRKTGICEKPVIIQPRCKNGFRRNRKSRQCENKTLKKKPDMRVIKRLSRKKINSIIQNEISIRRDNNMSPLQNNAKDKLKELRFPSNSYFKGIKTLRDAINISTLHNAYPFEQESHIEEEKQRIEKQRIEKQRIEKQRLEEQQRIEEEKQRLEEQQRIEEEKQRIEEEEKRIEEEKQRIEEKRIEEKRIEEKQRIEEEKRIEHKSISPKKTRNKSNRLSSQLSKIKPKKIQNIVIPMKDNYDDDMNESPKQKVTTPGKSPSNMTFPVFEEY
jgi:hypothetical protein